MFLLNLILAILRAPLKRVAELLGGDRGPAREQTAEAADEAAREQPVPTPPVPTRSRARPQPRRPAPRAPAAPPRSPRAKEVDEEPVLTAEFAEEGAEHGAGPEIHVDEPWEGYRQLKVSEVIARLPAATPTELAAVQLYESSHRRRSSVIRDVERRLRTQQV